MKTYRNKKTGAEFNSAFACSGGDWEEVKAAKNGEKGKEKVKTAPVQTEKEEDDG